MSVGDRDRHWCCDEHRPEVTATGCWCPLRTTPVFSKLLSYVRLLTGDRVGLDCNGQFVIVTADVGMPTAIRRLHFEVVL